MTDDVIDLRVRRILRAGEAARRAGYRVTAPPDAEADHWLSCIEAGEDEDGHPVHRTVWLSRKVAEDWQHARFGPFKPDSDGR